MKVGPVSVLFRLGKFVGHSLLDWQNRPSQYEEWDNCFLFVFFSVALPSGSHGRLSQRRFEKKVHVDTVVAFSGNRDFLLVAVFFLPSLFLLSCLFLLSSLFFLFCIVGSIST